MIYINESGILSASKISIHKAMQYLLSTYLNLQKNYLILISEHKNSGIQTSAGFPSWLHIEKESVPVGIQTWQNVKNLNW